MKTENGIIKRALYKRPVVWAAVLLLVVAGILAFSYRQIKVKESTFIEAPNLIKDLTEEEKANINRYLAYMQIQEEDRFGFTTTTGGASSLDLYNANALVSLVTMLPDYDLSGLRESMVFLESVNPRNLDFLNLVYLANIGQKLELVLNDSQLNDCLAKYYDDKTQLFFMSKPDDGIHIELVATLNVLRAFGNQLDMDRFCVVEGVKNALAEYEFLMESTNTMFNSGGDILCCLGALGLQKSVDEKQLEEWLDYWKVPYEEMSLNTLSDALIFSSFAEVMQVFMPDYGCERIYEYYCSLDRQQLEEIEDILMLSDVLKNGVTLDNATVNKALSEKAREQTEHLIAMGIDVRATVFGVALAEKTGFPYNKEKVKKYIQDTYNSYGESESLYIRVQTLYYNLMLDQLVNGYDQDYNDAFFQKQVNDLLSECNFGEQNLAADISSARRIVEIVSDLRTFGVDISLNSRQYTKLKNALEDFRQNTMLWESALIIDAYIIDDRLSLGVVVEEDLGKVLHSLTKDGGVCQYVDETARPDICTTYLFFSLLNGMNEYSYLESQKGFVLQTKVEEGVYTYDNEKSIIDLSTIAYGNSIAGFSYGGNSTVKGDQ